VQTAIEAFDKGILLRLAWRDVVPFDCGLLGPAIAMLVSSVPLPESVELAHDPDA